MVVFNSNNIRTYSIKEWVDAQKGEAHTPIWAQIDDFDKNIAGTLSSANLRGIQAYTNKTFNTLSSSGYLNSADTNNQLGLNPASMKTAFNLTAACIDTLHAKLSSIPTVPKAVSNKANAKGRKLAEDLNYIIQGLYHKYELSRMVALAFRDAMINRVGYLKVIKEKTPQGKVQLVIDKLYADEIIIDPSDGYYNKPYKMIHRKLVPITVMLNKYPEYKGFIQDCQIIEVRQTNTQNYTPSIQVAEAWCRNSFKEKGRHVISIQNCDLVDEDWDKDYFPVMKVEYNEAVIGYLGQSVVDELAPIQGEIDRILTTMQAIMKQVSIPRFLIDSRSNVNPNHITNRAGVFVFYDGQGGNAPIIHNGAAMPPELPAQLDFLINQGYARIGLSPQDTQGVKPAGLVSGEALKTVNDQKAERWQTLQKSYEKAHIRLADLILREVAGTNIKLSALDEKIGLRSISTKNIPKDAETFALQMFPISTLPTDPAGRLDTIATMLQINAITPDMVPDLLNMPDLNSKTVMMSAPRKYIEWSIEEMLDNYEYIAPEPYNDLPFSLTYALQQYAWEKMNDKDQDKLKLLRRYINDVRTLINVSSPQNQGATPGAPGTELAQGQPAPAPIPQGSNQ